MVCFTKTRQRNGTNCESETNLITRKLFLLNSLDKSRLNSVCAQYVCDKSENARACAKWPWNALDCRAIQLHSLVRFTVISHTPMRSRYETAPSGTNFTKGIKYRLRNCGHFVQGDIWVNEFACTYPGPAYGLPHPSPHNSYGSTSPKGIFMNYNCLCLSLYICVNRDRDTWSDYQCSRILREIRYTQSCHYIIEHWISHTLA